jgi:hypothetical protein
MLRPDVAAAIEKAWPDGEVGMSFDSEESWFWEAHLTLAGALHHIEGARLLYEREAEEEPSWMDSDDDDDIPIDGDFPRSYHLFFVSPADGAFELETETENETEPEFDEYESGEEFGESEMVTVQGRGHTGWSVAVSMIAPFAVITLSDYSIFDDGSTCDPAIERYAEDSEGNWIDPEEHFRKIQGQRLFHRLDKLRIRIAGILEKEGVTVLPETEWRKVVPWLRSDGEALMGDVISQPIRVFDAFFFQGV